MVMGAPKRSDIVLIVSALEILNCMSKNANKVEFWAKLRPKLYCSGALTNTFLCAGRTATYSQAVALEISMASSQN